MKKKAFAIRFKGSIGRLKHSQRFEMTATRRRESSSRWPEIFRENKFPRGAVARTSQPSVRPSEAHVLLYTYTRTKVSRKVGKLRYRVIWYYMMHYLRDKAFYAI